MRLTDLMTGPPGGWKFMEERTGYWAVGITFNQMVGKVAQHRTNMKFEQVNLPFETLAAEIEDWICRKMSSKDSARLCKSSENRVLGPRPGDLFSSIIHKITGRYALTCGRCLNRMGLMNQWGWWGCWRRRQEILGWITEEAAGRGHVVASDKLWTLFRAAWKEIHGHRVAQRKIAEPPRPAG